MDPKKTEPDGVRDLAPEQIAERLREGGLVSDEAFDRHLPEHLSRASSRFWTPVEVVSKVSAWLRGSRARRVVDIGSGAGKFCVVGALLTDCEFVGLEQRGHLVGAAQALAEAFDVSERVHFVEGTFGRVELAHFDAYYFFNPFEENLFAERQALDHVVLLNEEKWRRDVAAAEALMGRLPVGAQVITYNGFGGRVPGGFEESYVDRSMPSRLRAWRRIRGDDEGGSGQMDGPDD